jgi:hypothetical protein
MSSYKKQQKETKPMAEKNVGMQPAENVYTHCAVGVIFAVEKYLFNKTKMKTLFFLTVILILSGSLSAQTETPQNKKNQKLYNQFEISPKFKPQPDSLFLSDTFPGNLEFSFAPEIAPPKETDDTFNMPVVIVRPDFPSNMPIYVPDSSVHYYIKQAVPVQPIPKKK